VARWRVSQWFSPEPDLPPFSDGRTGNRALRVTVEPAPNGLQYTIHQSGQRMGCVLAGQPWEFDSFVAPITSPTPQAEAATKLSDLSSVNVGQMQRLTHRISLEPIAYTPAGPSCEHNKAVFMTAIVLSNRRKGQTFFYQLHLANLDHAARPFWWALGKNERYGFGDMLSTYGHLEAEVGKAASYEIDLAPRLKSLIKTAGHGMDADESNWHVSGTYHGQAIWGNVVASSRWSGFYLGYTQ
jgi:hypothetical protein